MATISKVNHKYRGGAKKILLGGRIKKKVNIQFSHKLILFIEVALYSLSDY